MLYHRPARERGQTDLGWLRSYHSFSFGSYYDPKHTGFSCLRVINDDTVAGGAGFDTHGHRDAEIISYITKGAVEHADTMGNRYVVPAGDVQRMSAGSGVMHSEYNASQRDPLKFLQIWIQPNVLGISPEYEQKSVDQQKTLATLVSPDGRDGSLRIHQNALMYKISLEPDQKLTFPLNNRSGYLHILEGAFQVSTARGENLTLLTADGLGVRDVPEIQMLSRQDSAQALWFDLPKPTV